MSEILQFKQKAEQVFTCACSLDFPDGGQWFYLHKNGTIQCGTCSRMLSEKRWGDDPVKRADATP